MSRQWVIDALNENEEVPPEYSKEDIFRFLEQCNERQISNTQFYDKTLLQLSTGGLALSLTLLTLGEGTGISTNSNIVLVSWVLFVIAIILGLINCTIANKDIEESQLKYQRKDRSELHTASRETDGGFRTLHKYVAKISLCSLLLAMLLSGYLLLTLTK